MNRRIHLVLLLVLAVLPRLSAQVVAVTMQLDTNVLAVGQSTLLHIFAQVLPDYQSNAYQIFSWYVDVLNTNGSAVSNNYSAMVKATSDNDPRTSSTGVNSGDSRLAIYDTFLNRPQAGVSNRIELMRFPVVAIAPGQTKFSIRAGSGATNLSEDFIVAPIDGDQFLTGGFYGTAFATLTVPSPSVSSNITCLTIAHTNLSGGLRQVTLRYCPLAGYDHYIDFRDQLAGGAGWQSVAGGPYNSGLYRDTNNVPSRFYRIRALPAGTLVSFPVSIANLGASQLKLSFPVNTNFNYTVEFRTNLVSGSWQPLPGGPHNSGNVIVTNNPAQRFFRVSAIQAF